MAYTPTTWNTGDTITPSALNKIEQGIAEGGGGGWDAVIRLTHGDDSGADTSANLTPSIVSGSYDALMSKCQNSGVPCILVEYFHPWGHRYAAPMGDVIYASAQGISINISGFFPTDNLFKTVGIIFWSNSDTLAWD